MSKPTPTQPIGESTSDENIYDEIEIEDMTYDETLQIYHYPCPCGDRFEIGLEDLRDGEEIAVCPSCSLQIRVIFDVQELPVAQQPQHLQQQVLQQEQKSAEVAG